MLLKVWAALILSLVSLNGSLSLAQSEDERRQGFYEHLKLNKEFDQAREAGLTDYLKEQADWEEKRKKDLQADKGRKVQESPVENGPEYKADRREKLQMYEEYEATQRAYVKEKKALEPKNAKEQAKREAWAMEEYGLDKQRPRFDITKRKMYGGKGSISPSFGGGYGGGSATGSSPSFPPPPSFDDFGGEGYVPPPYPPPEAFEPPPPPEGFPPPPPFPGDMGPEFDGGYFPPPPPPLPVPMEGENF